MTTNSVPLELLLRIDDRFESRNALANVLGDRYLYANNEVFTRIRDAAIGAGYRFVEMESPLWHDYLAFPLLSLRDIVEQKCIPYFDNISVLRGILRHRQGIEFPLRFLLTTLKKNYVLHESSHCVAHGILQQDTILTRLASDAERFVVTALLTEAFANTVERVATALPCQKSQLLLLALNSYMDYRNDRRDVLERAFATHGIERMFTVIFLSYWYSNLIPFRLPDRVLDDIMGSAWASLDQESRADMESLIHREFALSVGFREDTSPSYFRYYGCEREFLSLRESQLAGHVFLAELLELIPKFRNAVVPAAAAVAEAGVRDDAPQLVSE